MSLARTEADTPTAELTPSVIARPIITAGKGTSARVWPTVLRAALLVLGTRALLLLLLMGVVDREFTSDIPYNYVHMIERPWDGLLGRDVERAQYPPLLAQTLRLVVTPFRTVFGDLAGFRMSFILWEVALSAVLAWILLNLWGDKAARRGMLLYTALPIGWMCSTIMGQEEAIGATFLLLGVSALIRQRPASAAAWLSIGILIGKVLLAAPLAALLWCIPSRQRRKSGLVAALILGTAYGAIAVITSGEGGAGPVLSFVPTFRFGVGGWVLLDLIHPLQPATARAISGVIAGMACVTLWWRSCREGAPERARLLTVIAASFMWLLALFYHVQPEYYLLVLPLMIPLVRGREDVLRLVGLSTAPWVVNLAYGVGKALMVADPADPRYAFALLWQTWSPIPASLLHVPALLLCTILTAEAALDLSRRACSPDPMISKS